jgi:hypothetical protein
LKEQALKANKNLKLTPRLPESTTRQIEFVGSQQKEKGKAGIEDVGKIGTTKLKLKGIGPMN